MRNRRLAALLTGALLAGSLTAGASVALASADRAPAPRPAPASPAPGGPGTAGRADAARTVEVLGTLGDVTRGVDQLVSAARRGAGNSQMQQTATALGNAAQQLVEMASSSRPGPSGQSRPGRGSRAVPGKDRSVDDSVAALKRSVRTLLASTDGNDQGGLEKAVSDIAASVVDVVKAVLDAIGGQLPGKA